MLNVATHLVPFNALAYLVMVTILKMTYAKVDVVAIRVAGKHIVMVVETV